jgi:hypothetical protein
VLKRKMGEKRKPQMYADERRWERGECLREDFWFLWLVITRSKATSCSVKESRTVIEKP